MKSCARPKGPIKQCILDEIGLEGLHGISIDGLWVRLAVAFENNVFSDAFKSQIWNIIKKSSDLILFYELPEPRRLIKPYNRFKAKEGEDEDFSRTHKIYPIQEAEFTGSCQNFKERKLIDFDTIKNLSLKATKNQYGDHLIMVGTQAFRESILFPNNAQYPIEITKLLYCILEAIGRSRYNGEKTVGKYSLQNYCKDSSELFYLRNKLVAQNLIRKQPFAETMNGRAVYGFLLSLPRFFVQIKSKPVVIIEIMYNMLIDRPNCQMEFDKMKLEFSKEIGKSLRKLLLTIFFRKFLEVIKVKYRDEYPDAPRDKWKRKGCEEERLVTVIRLKDPTIKLEDMLKGEHSLNSDSNEVDKVEFLNDSNFLLDMSYKEQLYRAIERTGPIGCSQTDMIKYMATNRFIIRALVKKLLANGLLTQYWEDFGRQKTRMYVALEHAQNAPINKIEGLAEAADELESLKCDDANIPEDTAKRLDAYEENIGTVPIDNLTNVLATVKDISESIAVKITDRQKQQTLRQVKRQKIIVNTVNERLLLDKATIRKVVIETETSDGYKDQICAKSLFRILTWLAEMKIIKVFDIKLEMRKCIRVYRYIAHPKLHENHQLVQEEVVKLKNQLHSTVEERELREKRELNNSCKNDSTVAGEKSDTGHAKPFYRRAPKFLTCRFFHEFLYYLIYEMNSNKNPIVDKDNIIESLTESYPQYDLNDLDNDLITFYDDNLSWKMFIPPLTRNNDKPHGWAYILDMYVRIPLSMLTRLYQIDKDVHPLLNEYLNHPIKQHYLLQKLPNELQEMIFQFRVGKTCLSFFKILSCIGLVQLGKRNFKDPKETWFFLNRNGVLLDTSISEPAYRFTSLNKEYPEHRYRFDTFQDVQNYWNFLYKTCCVTRLGVRIDVQQKNKQEQEELPTVEFDMAPVNDIGYIPGDKRGAGGLDSLLFAHLKMNWCLAVKGHPVKSKGKSSSATRTLIKLGVLKSKKLSCTTAGAKRRKLTLVAGRKILIQKNNRNQKRAFNSASDTTKSKRARNMDYDERDREALMRMDSLRVQWNKDEDNLLKVCRAVFLYLSNSVSQLHRIISGHNYRDVLHWGLNARNKTSRACQRRILYILKQKPNTDLSAWIHELSRNRHIKQRFGSKFLQNLRKIYPSDVEFSEALQVHFVQLVYYLNRVIKNANLSLKNECILPDTLTQFNVFYKECINPPDFNTKGLKHFDPTTEEEIEISTINSIMHSTMCCNKDKTLYNIQIFEIYKSYKEDTLSKAFKKAKKDNLVVCPRGQRKAGLMTGSAYTLSVKYRQALYLNIPYEMFDMFYEKFEIFVNIFFNETKTNEQGVLEFKTINPGAFFLLTEMSANNIITVDIEIPHKILTIDSNQQQNINNSDRILDHFRQIFDNAPKTEYSKIFEEANRLDDINEFGRSTTRVKFNIANENYKLAYNPYDTLLKLSEAYLHFYCALDHLNKILDLDFTRFTADNFCPFNCILKNTSFVGAVERIIHDKKLILEDLIRSTESEDITENIIILNQRNIMEVYSRLQTEIRKRNEATNLKDLGKISTNLKTTPVDILQLCKDITEYSDKDDSYQKHEYEPTVNKEEKIVRAQDVFVVNLPTLKIRYNELESEDVEKVDFKNRNVPDQLVSADINREAILQKIISYSIWLHHGSIEKLQEDEDFKSFTFEFQSFMLDVLNFIETFPLGASGEDLVGKFITEAELSIAVIILSRHYLIMRLGVENFMYVHKKHIAPWVVQTYHIKRLDMEALQGSIIQIDSSNISSKRKLSSDESCQGDAKYSKSDDGKRIPKPVERYENLDNVQQTKVFVPRDKETIVIRPCPWIRINGTLNRRVLDKWLGSVLLDCITHCGQTVRQLCINFSQMHPVNIMCLLEVLKDLDCIELNMVKRPSCISLFTKFEDVTEEPATEFSKVSDVFIVTLPNAVQNVSVFIGEKRYKTDFF